MKILKFYFLLLMSPSLLFSGCMKTQNAEIVNLRCEYMTEPLGIDTPSPRFTWEYSSEGSFSQESARIIVSDNYDDVMNDIGNVWDGVCMGSSTLLAYNSSVKLEPMKKYYWRVYASGSKGEEAVSEPASFETAMTAPGDWSARWISDGKDKEEKPSPLFRKQFDVKSGEISQARLYITGLGYYEAWMNDKRIGDRMLDPAFTHFDKRVYYSVYDVTDMLLAGPNVIATVLGNGWFNIQSLAVWRFDLARWRQRPMMLCELHIEYADGSKEVVCSDNSWKTSEGAYRFNNLYSGDLYDANLEEEGWRTVGFDDSHWASAVEKNAPAPVIRSEMFPPIRVTKELAAKELNKISEKLYVYHFPENTAGTQRLKIKGEKGTVIKIRAGEHIYPDGRLNRSTLDVYFQREANEAPLRPVEGEEFQMNTYILKGGGLEEYTPSFNYHGFQYVEVESDRPVSLDRESLTALVMHTDVQQVGSFSCSDQTLNKIWDATYRSYLSNLYSIPTDCPQREKNGWTADAWVAIDLALLGFDGITVYEKWMRDFVDNIHDDGRISGIIPTHDGWGYADWIGPVWDAAMFIIPKAIYQYYGDSRAIETIYPVCVRYLDYLKTREDSDGLVTYGIGDWVPYDTQTPTDYTSSCYYYYDYVLMAEFASLTGNDPAPYLRKAEQLKDKINSKYLDKNKGIYSNGSIAALAVPLYLGLVPEDIADNVAANMVELIKGKEYRADFGMLGTKTVLRMLTKYGYTEEAYKMAVQPEEPGWAIWMNKGMTTLAERWNKGNYPDISDNHVFFGDISAWMLNTFAGINYDEQEPGFRHFTIRPHYVEGLQWARGEYDSVNGKIVSHWERDGSKIVLSVTIPQNTTATVYTGETKRELQGGTYKFKFRTL